MNVQTAYRQEKLTYIATGTAKSQAKKARQVQSGKAKMQWGQNQSICI